MSRRFHSTILFATVSMCLSIREKTGLDTVALSGGVFQNRILFRFLLQQLLQEEFRVLYHSRVPPNDGGVSFGQGMVALNNLREDTSCV
jgi:hydrogenase maturation protein HypF